MNEPDDLIENIVAIVAFVLIWGVIILGILFAVFVPLILALTR